MLFLGKLNKEVGLSLLIFGVVFTLSLFGFSDQVRGYVSPGDYPVVDAGANKVTYPKLSVALSGSGSDVTSYLWQAVSGPGTITFGTPTSTSSTASATQAGVYTLRLTATNNRGSVYDDMTLTVYKSGDINNDGRVDKKDFTILLYNWSNKVNSMADLNADSAVDVKDFTILLYWWQG